ncbi:circadian locomoter output cycles protein kaput-like [Ylistrum balloti]|uniref:circadian locomoter output cycles protein kaput-like n=1 Tax=Ylistrum balloti TaxID=509963 RepID=UPI00290593A9|nr:circadian locomoter output cycles protein kaput-like [Ylistrum balloti]
MANPHLRPPKCQTCPKQWLTPTCDPQNVKPVLNNDEFFIVNNDFCLILPKILGVSCKSVYVLNSPIHGKDKEKCQHHEDKDNMKKLSRKAGEKLRRDKMKRYLSVLAQEIPWISDKNHRVDRSQILKLTVNYLKFHHGVKEKKMAPKKWKPNFLSSDTLQQCLIEAAGGFLMVVTHTGIVVYVSESISSILGHLPVNVIGLPIATLLHCDDCETFSRQFQIADEHVFMSNSMPTEQDRVQISTFKSNHRSFLVQMQILPKYGDKLQYETIHFLGKISTDDTKTGGRTVPSSNKQNTWLVAVGRPVRNRVIHELSVMGLDKLEWCSQHSMDGTILFNDQRVSQCLGLFSEESTGYSCYEYIVPEDIQAVSISHMKIMTDNEVPQTIFRLKIPNQSVKFVLSRSVIVRDTWTKEAKFISSINIIIDKTEGDQLLEEQKKKVNTLIAVTKQLSLQEDISEFPLHDKDGAENSEIKNDGDKGEKNPLTSNKDFESKASAMSSGSMEENSQTIVGTSETISGSPPILSPQISGREDSALRCSVGSLYVPCGEGSPFHNHEARSCQSHSEERPHVHHGSPYANTAVNCENLLSVTEEGSLCDQVLQTQVNKQNVNNWTDYLTEVEMDSDISNTQDAYSDRSNLVHCQSDKSSPTHSCLDTNRSNESNLKFSQPILIHSQSHEDQACHNKTTVLRTLCPDQTNLKEANVSLNTPCNVDSNHSRPTSFPVDQSSTTQSNLLQNQSNQEQFSTPYNTYVSFESNVDHNHTSCEGSSPLCTQSSQVQPVSFFTKTSPKKFISGCGDHYACQSCLPLDWTSHKNSKEISSPLLSQLPPPMLVGQTSFRHESNLVQSNHSNQLHFEQAGLTYEDIDLLSTVQSSSEPSGNVDDKTSFYKEQRSGLSPHRCAQQNHGRLCHSGPGDIPSSIPEVISSKLHLVHGSRKISNADFDVIHNGSNLMVKQNKINNSSFNEEEPKYVSVNKSTEDVQKKSDSAYLQLADQINAKHKQLNELLLSQESILDQVQRNLSSVTNTQTDIGESSSGLLQNVFKLKASVQEQKMQISNLEEEFIARLSDMI